MLKTSKTSHHSKYSCLKMGIMLLLSNSDNCYEDQDNPHGASKGLGTVVGPKSPFSNPQV